MKDSNKELTVVDITTGELVKLKDASPMQVSTYLTNLTTKIKMLQKIEKMIKKEINPTLQFEDDKNYIMFGNHKITKSYRNSLDMKSIEEKGTKKEKEWLNKLRSRYILQSEVIRWN